MKYRLLATTQFQRDVEEILSALDNDRKLKEEALRNNDTIISAIYARLENPTAAEVFYPYEGSDAYYSLDVCDCTIYYVVCDDIMELRRITMMMWKFTDF